MEGNIPVPDNILEYPMDGGTRIVCRWNRDNSTLGVLLVFACAMLAFIAFWCFALGGEKESFADLIQRFLSLPQWTLLGTIFFTIAVMYGLLARFINIVEIRLTPVDVEIGIHPLPWSGRRSVTRSDIKRLFVEEQSKTDSYGRVIKNYELHFVDPNGARRPLILFLRAHEALYLRRRLGEILALDDLSVGGSGCA